jgi:hypothetical protein
MTTLYPIPFGFGNHGETSGSSINGAKDIVPLTLIGVSGNKIFKPLHYLLHYAVINNAQPG